MDSITELKENKVLEKQEEYELKCGCTCSLINGKYITIQCDDHDWEQDDIPYTKRTKMRTYRER